MNVSVLLSVMRRPPARVIEFGCGTGWISLILAQQGYDVLGLDISPDAIAIADASRGPLALPNLKFQVADYERASDGPPADYVIFHDALHHCESEVDTLRAAFDSLAPGGAAICIEPGDGHHASPNSRRAVEQFGVHEKDMPPRKIIRFATQVGFKRHLVLPWPWFFLRSVFRPGYSRATTQGDLRGRKFYSFWRVVRSYFTTRAQGVVLLFK